VSKTKKLPPAQEKEKTLEILLASDTRGKEGIQHFNTRGVIAKGGKV